MTTFYAEETDHSGKRCPVLYHGRRPGEKKISGARRGLVPESVKKVKPEHRSKSLDWLKDRYGTESIFT